MALTRACQCLRQFGKFNKTGRIGIGEAVRFCAEDRIRPHRTI